VVWVVQAGRGMVRPRHVPDRNYVAALLLWPAPPPPGTCCPPRSWAAAARPPAGAAWTSGPAQGCSSSSRRCCWTNWARPAASTWSGSWSTPPASARSKGALTGANPVDRGKQGTKLHLAGDAGGLPLAVVLTAANAHDSTMLGAVVDDIPPIRMPTRQRRRRPGTVHADHADKGYDYPRCRAELRRRVGSPPHRPAPRGVLAAAWPPPLTRLRRPR
jgi:hypothetical protein